VQADRVGKQALAVAEVAVDEELERWLGGAVPERTLRQFGATLSRLRAVGPKAVALEETA